MADRKTFSRYNMRCGLVLKAEKAGVRLTSFNIPQLDQRFLVLTGKDIVVNNSITMLGGRIPLLAVDKIDYIGQPLLALFGPDYESVELIMEKIEVNTEPFSEEEKPVLESAIPSLSFSWGQEEIPDEETLKGFKKVDSTFKFDHTPFISSLRYSIGVWQDGNNIHVQAPMQWPKLVQDSISKTIDKEAKNIILHPIKSNPRYDEYLLYPAIYSTLAAIAMLTTGLPVEIRMVGESARAGITIQRTTYLNEEHRPVVENVKMTIDQGAYSFAGSEYQRQAMTGLLPKYTVKSFSAEVSIIKSWKQPASFCGSLGYSEAMAGTEFHTSRLADKSEYTPVQLREYIKREKTKFTDYAPAYSLEDKSKLDGIAKESVFNRKWASNSFHHGDFGLLGALRGIGIATGLGIAGFSTTLAKEENFSAMMNYTAKKNIIINSSANLSQSAMKYCRDLIVSKFQEETTAENVLFLEQNNETIDSGPDVLSRFQTCFPSQLGAAAKQLGSLINKAKPPISLKFDAENIFSPCEFEYTGYGSLIIEIEIRKKNFIPSVKAVWGNFCIANILAKGDAKDRARQAILSTLKECGGEISPNMKLNVEISQSNDTSDNLAPISSIAKGLTMGAFSSALFQAAGMEAAFLPTDAARLESVINGGKA